MAVMVAVSPALPPLVDIDGVVSLVMLSVLDAPVSDVASKSGAVGAARIVMFSGALGREMLPAVSMSVATTVQLPNVRAGSVHDVSVPTTYEHERVVVALLAEIVAILPVAPPLVDTAGVVSLVTLSVLDAPVSDDASRSGVVGASGAVGSMVIEVAGLDAVRVPDGSVNVPVRLQLPAANVGSVHALSEPTV